jgi:hypothetical protein
MGNPDNPLVRTLQISHATEQGAQYAKQRIEDILKSKPSFAADAGPQSRTTSIQVVIPDKDVGLCIGRQGCVIKHMQNTTNTRIQIPQNANPGEMHRVATISGSEEGTQQVKAMIERIVAEQSAASVMSGAPYMGQQQQQQAYYAPQDQGYSAEWAAYHAAQAAVAEKQQQQQQQQQQAAAAPASVASTAAVAGGQASPDAYYEQFFRYAYYYGEEAARKYYGAWSPPVGTPNPYGVNPNGVQAAPVAAPATAEAAAAAAAAAAPTSAPAPVAAAPAASEARETSKRHVSNLPAWMTKKS